jgi:hypothetical protein
MQQVNVGDDANDDLLDLHLVAGHVWKKFTNYVEELL